MVSICLVVMLSMMLSMVSAMDGHVKRMGCARLVFSSLKVELGNTLDDWKRGRLDFVSKR